jgi:hypothetical protein
MWNTMKITALNAINEIVSNFVAGIQTISGFISTMFSSSGALVTLMQTAFTTAANYLKESLYGALADFMEAIGRSGMADTFRYQSETARRAIEKDLFAIGAQIEEVGHQASEAGAAMPKEFAKNKAALDPLFDLTDEFAEQKALQEGISAELAKTQPVTEAIAVAGQEYSEALKESKLSLQGSEVLSSNIALNLESAALSSDRIAPAFSLGEESSGKVAMDLESTVPHAEQASEFLAEGANATNALDINGRSYAASAAAAANSVNNAKLDAQITSELFTGLSDRMNSAANATSGTLDKMREAFHFGKMTQEEISLMRKLESQAASAENARDRAYARAAAMEQAGLEKSAHNARMKADASFTKSMEKIAPDLAKGSEAAKRALEEAATNSGQDLSSGGEDAGAALERGGEAAAKPIESAAAAIKEAVSALSASIATERTLLEVAAYLKSLDKKLPQHALI